MANMFLSDYEKRVKALENYKQAIINEVVHIIKAISVDPVIIGNMVYFYVRENGKDVPAYCYLSDYNKNNPKFLPIYDKDNTCEFGWNNFEECCRIFDVIRNTLMNGIH